MYVMYSLFLYMLVQFFVNHFGYKGCCSNEYVHNFNKIGTPYTVCPDFLWSGLCTFIFCSLFLFLFY